MTTSTYDVQELLDIYEQHDKESKQRKRGKILDLWKSIRAAAKFDSTTVVYKLGSPRSEGEATHDLFEYLRDELAKIGRFKCVYERAATGSPYMTVTWDRYDLRLPANATTAK
jgi:hypothetical protein